MPLGRDSLLLCLFRCFFVSARDAQAARGNLYLQIFSAELRHVGVDGEFGFSLRNIHWNVKEYLGLSAQPVLAVMAVLKTAGLEQLVGAPSNQVFDFRCKLENQIAGNFENRCPNRSLRRRTTRDVHLPHDGIEGYARNNVLGDFAADGWAPPGLTQRQSIEAEVVDRSRDALALLCNQRQSRRLE